MTSSPSSVPGCQDPNLSWIWDLDADEFLQELEHVDNWQDALWLRCEQDLSLFCAAFFGERLSLPYSAFHRDLVSRPKAPWQERKHPQRIADAAPRGNAKSTIESYCNLIHDAVYGYEAFVGIISTTYDLSEDLVTDLHRAFTQPELHPDLHEVYGPFLVIGSKTDFVVHVRGQDARGTRFAAFSFGGSIRGSKHAGIRFTKVVIDDGEHPEKVRSPMQREKVWDYLVKDILKAGDKFSIFRVVGTVLHQDSMLNRVIGYAGGEHGLGWRGRRWQAITSWPKNMRLWSRCRELWADLTDPHRQDTARNYYARHKDRMDEGAAVLWAEKESLYDLMVMLWTDGAASFNSEKQNIATDPLRQVFFPEKWGRCSFDGQFITNSKGRRISVTSCEIAVWLDPRASDEIEKNDYASLSIAAKDPHGYMYLLKTLMRRTDTLGQLQMLWSVFDMFGPRAMYGYEDNGFAKLIGDLLHAQRQIRKKSGKTWSFQLQGYASTKNKNDRIARLAPKLELGWIEVADDLSPEVLDQWTQLPSGTHDDGPDSGERAIWLLEGGGTATATTRGRMNG